MQLKLKLDEDTSDALKEKALYAQYEKEEWKAIRPHNINSIESNGVLGNIMYKTLDAIQDYKNNDFKPPNPSEYINLMTKGTNVELELPYTPAEAKPFLVNLQKRAGNLHAILSELFNKQQVIPFSFLQDFLNTYDIKEILGILKNMSIHLGRGIFVLNSDRVYSNEINPSEYRKIRNQILEIFKNMLKSNNLNGITIHEITVILKENYNRIIVNRVLLDLCEKCGENWKLRFTEDAIHDFEKIVEIENIPKISEEIKGNIAQEAHLSPPKKISKKNLGKEELELNIKNLVINELRNEGVKTYMQLLNLAKQTVESSLYTELEEILQKIINENCITIKNAILLIQSDNLELNSVFLIL